MARTPTDTTTPDTVVELAEPTRFKKVILQRPAGNQDLGQYLGFNDVSGVYPFDTPINLPAEMVDFFREQKVAEAHPGPDGQPIITYVNQFHIIDA